MAFNPLQLRFIRFLGPGKETVHFPFKSGFNILYGSSDTGKTFLVEAIDFMLGAGDDLRDIPERNGSTPSFWASPRTARITPFTGA